MSQVFKSLHCNDLRSSIRQRVIQQRKQLRNSFQEKKLLDLGLYERADELQKPITEAIINTYEKVKDNIQEMKRSIEILPAKYLFLYLLCLNYTIILMMFYH
jgi:hypothetical protein